MNKELKSALLKYLYNNEENVLVTRDVKLMGILNSYEPGVKPSPEEVEKRYNELLEQETLAVKPVAEQQQIIPEDQSGTNVIETPSTLIERTRKNVLTKTLRNPDVHVSTTKKLNQIGYANVVLMSIIVIIIVAIICVFIFM